MKNYDISWLYPFFSFPWQNKSQIEKYLCYSIYPKSLFRGASDLFQRKVVDC